MSGLRYGRRSRCDVILTRDDHIPGHAGGVGGAGSTPGEHFHRSSRGTCVALFHGPALPPMKILVTNYDLNHYAGTETFIYALSVELRRIGHEVICFSPRLGAVAQRLAAAGIAVTGDL